MRAVGNHHRSHVGIRGNDGNDPIGGTECADALVGGSGAYAVPAIAVAQHRSRSGFFDIDCASVGLIFRQFSIEFCRRGGIVAIRPRFQPFVVNWVDTPSAAPQNSTLCG